MRSILIYLSIWLHLSQKNSRSPEEVLNDLGSNIEMIFLCQLVKPELLGTAIKSTLQKILVKNAEIIEQIKDT